MSLEILPCLWSDSHQLAVCDCFLRFRHYFCPHLNFISHFIFFLFFEGLISLAPVTWPFKACATRAVLVETPLRRLGQMQLVCLIAGNSFCWRPSSCAQEVQEAVRTSPTREGRNSAELRACPPVERGCWQLAMDGCSHSEHHLSMQGTCLWTSCDVRTWQRPLQDSVRIPSGYICMD